MKDRIRTFACRRSFAAIGVAVALVVALPARRACGVEGTIDLAGYYAYEEWEEIREDYEYMPGGAVGVTLRIGRMGEFFGRMTAVLGGFANDSLGEDAQLWKHYLSAGLRLRLGSETVWFSIGAGPRIGQLYMGETYHGETYSMRILRIGGLGSAGVRFRVGERVVLSIDYGVGWFNLQRDVSDEYADDEWWKSWEADYLPEGFTTREHEAMLGIGIRFGSSAKARTSAPERESVGWEEEEENAPASPYAEAMARGNEAYKQGDYDRAARHFAEAVRIEKTPEAFYRFLVCEYELGGREVVAKKCDLLLEKMALGVYEARFRALRDKAREEPAGPRSRPSN